MENKLIEELQRQGYFEIRECVRTGKLYGLIHLNSVVTLCCDIHKTYFQTGYHYTCEEDAVPALRDFHARGFVGEPSGYIKAKGLETPDSEFQTWINRAQFSAINAPSEDSAVLLVSDVERYFRNRAKAFPDSAVNPKTSPEN